jgi:hypothetical protein
MIAATITTTKPLIVHGSQSSDDASPAFDVAGTALVVFVVWLDAVGLGLGLGLDCGEVCEEPEELLLVVLEFSDGSSLTPG